MKNIFKKTTEKAADAKATPATKKVVDTQTLATPVAPVPSNSPAQTPVNPTIGQMPNNWAQKVSRMRANHPTIGDINLQDGSWEEILTRIQLKLGKTRAEVEQIIAAL